MHTKNILFLHVMYEHSMFACKNLEHHAYDKIEFKSTTPFNSRTGISETNSRRRQRMKEWHNYSIRTSIEFGTSQILLYVIIP